MINNLSKIGYNFNGLVDLQNSMLFYAFNIQLQDGMADGEYSYTLYDENDVVKATGLLQIGDYQPENNKTYSAQTENGYIQYKG